MPALGTKASAAAAALLLLLLYVTADSASGPVAAGHPSATTGAWLRVAVISSSAAVAGMHLAEPERSVVFTVLCNTSMSAAGHGAAMGLPWSSTRVT